MNRQEKRDWLWVLWLVAIAVLLLWWTREPPTTGGESSQYDNLAYGEPAQSDFVTNRMGYALGFRNDWRQPSWVAYRLTPQEASSKEKKRANCFATDKGIPNAMSATPQDYAKSGYDKGHLAPAGDMCWSTDAMRESFLMSNMAPQVPSFNRGVWNMLEKHLRNFAALGKPLFIYTGPIFKECSHTNGIGKSNVLVPSAFYKAVYNETPNEESMIAFVIPNSSANAPLSVYAISIDSLEKMTGMDFFNTLPKKKQEELESKVELKSWLLREEP